MLLALWFIDPHQPHLGQLTSPPRSAAFGRRLPAERQLTIGIGPGGDVAKEFEVVGNDIKQRGAWTNETIEVAQLLWSAEPGKPVSYEGRFAKFHDAVMDQGGNHTYRGPRPRLWVGGRSEAAPTTTLPRSW